MIIDVDIDNIFQALTKAGFNILIKCEEAESGSGSVSMYFADIKYGKAEAECNECNECNRCACDAIPETPNPFIVQHEQERDKMAKLGLSGLSYHEQSKIIRKAEKYIQEHGVDDEEYKVIVHHQMRDNYLVYKKYLESEK